MSLTDRINNPDRRTDEPRPSFRLPRWAQITAAVVAAIAVLIFVGNLNSYDEGHAVGVASVTPPPTPEPVPQPTPLVIEVPGPTIETVPAECTEAIRAADLLVQTAIQMPLDTLNAYVDYPDENLAEFGARVETIIADFDADTLTSDWDDYSDFADDCIAVAP